jgi:outer membrane immunogenic protein
MRKLGILAAAAASAIFAVGAASAADLPVYTKAPPPLPPPMYNWTGFYIGANGGYGWAREEWFFSPAGTNVNNKTNGALGGGQIGYNWELPSNLVVGVEADGDWGDIKGANPCPNPAFNCFSKTDDLASFRGRLGWAAGTTGEWLLYGTGGVAYAHTNNSALTVVGALPAATAAGTSTGVFNTDRWGYATGFGVEWGFAPNWSARAEYVHYGFGTTTAPVLTLSVANTTSLRLDADTITVGINYRWGGPVVAKY